MQPLYVNRQTERHQFDDRKTADGALEKMGFDCVAGAWMRGGNEYAQIEGNNRSGIVVRIGKVF